MQKLLAEVKTGKMVGKSSGGSGVGCGPHRRSCAINKFKAEREEMLAVFSEITEQERLRKIISTPLEDSELGTHPFEKKGNYFNDWVMWENYMAADLRWNHLLQQQDSYLKFVLNATQDSLPTPSRLNTWQEESAGDGLCPLGCREKGTLKRILCSCWKALREEPQSRITWRHDSILLAIFRGVMDRIQEANAQSRQEDALPSIKLKSVETLDGDSLISNASGN